MGRREGGEEEVEVEEEEEEEGRHRMERSCVEEFCVLCAGFSVVMGM